MAYKTGNGRGAELEAFWLIHKKTTPEAGVSPNLRAVDSIVNW